MSSTHNIHGAPPGLIPEYVGCSDEDSVDDLSGMFQVQDLVLLIVDSLALVTYIPGNIFIIVKNIQNMVKTRRQSPLLRLILGVSGINIIQGLLKILSTFVMTNIERTVVSKVYVTLCLVLTSCNLWFSTWLCIYYCLQTVQLKFKCYVSLQKTFPQMVPRLHILSVLVSSVMGVPVVVKILVDQSLNTTLSTLPSNATFNVTFSSNGLMTSVGSALEAVSYAVSFLGFLLMSSSSLAIIVSLCLNLRHVRPKKGSPKNPDAEACLKAHVLRMDAAKAVSSIAGINVVLYAAVHVLSSTAGGAIWMLPFSFANTIFQILSCVNLLKGHVNLSRMSICRFCNKKYVNEIVN